MREGLNSVQSVSELASLIRLEYRVRARGLPANLAKKMLGDVLCSDKTVRSTYCHMLVRAVLTPFDQRRPL